MSFLEAYLPSAVSAEERRHDPDIEMDDTQMAESEGGSVEKQAWDVVSWTSDMIFSVTATDSQKEKAEAERLFQKKLQRVRPLALKQLSFSIFLLLWVFDFSQSLNRSS